MYGRGRRSKKKLKKSYVDEKELKSVMLSQLCPFFQCFRRSVRIILMTVSIEMVELMIAITENSNESHLESFDQSKVPLVRVSRSVSISCDVEKQFQL